MAKSDIRTRIGLRIKELRYDAGLSQEAFAWRIGMARSYLAEVETGKRNISIANLEKIAIGLDIPLKDFFDSPLFS